MLGGTRSAADRWREETLRYVARVNAFVARGEASDWEDAGPDPRDTRDRDLAEKILDELRAANRSGRWRELRAEMPPAHAPFVPWLEERALPMTHVVWVDDQRVAATSGSPWTTEITRVYDLEGQATLLPDVAFVSRSMDGEIFARVGLRTMTLHRGFDGPPVLELELPPGDLGVPGGIPDAKEHPILGVTPLSSADGALVLSHSGVFLVRASEQRRLFPTPEGMDELTTEAEREGESPALYFDMIHAALSPSEKLVALGHQDSGHLLISLDGEIRGVFGPIESSYPHHATFSPDGTRAYFNSCHFYNGATVGANVADLVGIELDPYEEDERIHLVEDEARVYASCLRGDDIYLGDAYGYVRVRAPEGRDLGRHFVGSTVEGLDMSPDGAHLAVGTAAGFLSVIELGAGRPDHQIGNLPHRERIRYIQWKNESLLRW